MRSFTYQYAYHWKKIKHNKKPDSKPSGIVGLYNIDYLRSGTRGMIIRRHCKYGITLLIHYYYKFRHTIKPDNKHDGIVCHLITQSICKQTVITYHNFRLYNIDILHTVIIVTRGITNT